MENSEEDLITVNWLEQSVKLREKYNSLTSEDLLFVPGYQESLFDRIGLRLGMNREEVIRIIKRNMQGSA